MPSIAICRVSLVRKLAIRMSSTKVSYEEAVQKLNLLQSNKSTIEQIRKDIKAGQRCTNLEDMERYLKRTGVSLTMLDKLSVIHVAGTKGKGSTSAMCESILRSYGYRTGFYSSPHLVAVRERIRLDGCILSKDKFAEHFHRVYNALYSTQEFEGDMPKYFAFLTVLAFNVFLKEMIDVAIVEVGIGGIVDYTNILRKVPVVGITALGLDHTSILGNTLPEIAAAKAGIMKIGCEAFTVQQPPEAMDVLKSVAESVKCPLNIVPEFSTYKFENGYRLSIDLEAYKINASLAVQLAHAWMRINKNTVHNSREKTIDTLNKNTIAGLKNCKWPGRYQVIKLDYAEFYLDGAHTKESMDVCAEWFKGKNRDRTKVLIFSATGDRDAEVLLNPLKDINFQSAFLVIPKALKEVNKQDDNYSILEQNELLSRCESYAKIWKKLNSTSEINVSECVSDVLNDIKNNKKGASVLVTGSLHLVGATLSLIDPNLSEE